MKKEYRYNCFYSFIVEAENEEDAEEKADEFLAGEEAQGVRLQDMAVELAEE